MFLLILLFTLSIPGWSGKKGFSSHTPVSICQSSLENPSYSNLIGHYKLSTHLNIEIVEPVLSLSPETGSIEQKHPGISKAIFTAFIRIGYFRFVDARPIHKTDVEFFVNSYLRTIRELQKYCIQFHLTNTECDLLQQAIDYIKSRLNIVTSSYNYFVPTSYMIGLMESEAKMMTSIFTQLIVAFHFAGDKHYLNVKLADIYPEKFVRFSKPQKRKYNIEIDVLIQRKAQSDLWIEVKNTRAKLVADMIDGSDYNDSFHEADQLILQREVDFESIDRSELLRLNEQIDINKKVRSELAFENEPQIIIGLRHIKSQSEMESIYSMGSDGVFILHPDTTPFFSGVRETVHRSLLLKKLLSGHNLRDLVNKNYYPTPNYIKTVSKKLKLFAGDKQHVVLSLFETDAPKGKHFSYLNYEHFQRDFVNHLAASGGRRLDTEPFYSLIEAIDEIILTPSNKLLENDSYLKSAKVIYTTQPPPLCTLNETDGWCIAKSQDLTDSKKLSLYISLSKNLFLHLEYTTD